MPEQILASKLSLPECHCLFRLEQQMVRQRGFINRDAFIDEQDEVFKEWEQQGYIELNADELKHLEQEQINKQQLTHSCHLSGELWLAAASLRRIYACDL